MTSPRVPSPVRLRLGHSCWRGGRALKVALFANPQPGLSRGEFPGLLPRTAVIVSEFRVLVQANKPSARDRSERQRDRLRAATAPTPPTPDAGAHPFLDAEI